jgi:beta-lactamase regulating signal transducer with metallopeptidase domain
MGTAMQTLLEIGLSNAVVATFLAVIAALVSRVCHRPAVAHVLWLLVLIKLVTPPVMTIPLPVPAAASLAAARAATPRPDALARDTGDVIGTDAALTAELVALLTPVLPDRISREKDSGQQPAPAEAHPVESWLGTSWESGRIQQGIGTAWLAGALVCLFLAIVRIQAFRRLLRFARPAPAPVQDQAEFLASRLGLSRCPRVWLAPGRVSPLLWAVGGRAQLVLPSALVDGLTPEQRATLLAHELAHACRHDHWVRWLELAVTCLYWWHPVAWWARRRVQQAEEECCDAWVVWALPSAAKDYARALLRTVEFLDSRPVLPPAASGVGHLHLLKRRLTMIVREPLSPRLPLPAYLGAVLIGLLVLPLSLQPAAAQSSDKADIVASPADEPEVAVLAQEQDQPDSAALPRQREMERRLDRLEQRLERLLEEVKSARGEANPERAIQLERKAKTAASKDAMPEKKTITARVIKKEDKTTEKQDKSEDGKRRVRVIELQDLEKLAPERREEIKRRIDEAVKKSLDPEKMEEMHKKIEAAVKEIHPERLEIMAKDLQKSISKNLDPEMKEMHKKIEEAVKQIHPERFEDLSKRIEEAVSRSLEARQKEATRAGARAREAAPRGDSRNLEERMERLERKMNQVLDQLEASRRSREKN